MAVFASRFHIHHVVHLSVTRDERFGIRDRTSFVQCLSNDPHKKESVNGNARWIVNFFLLLQLVISLAKTQ